MEICVTYMILDNVAGIQARRLSKAKHWTYGTSSNSLIIRQVLTKKIVVCFVLIFSCV